MNADLLSYNSDENKIKEKSGFIRSKVNEVMGIMSDVIWSIDSRNDNFESLVDRAHHFVSTFLKQEEIEVEFINNIDDENKMLKIDFRQNIMMIIKEAVNNAVKHSSCNKIKIEMSYKNRKFDLLISDNGKGLNSQEQKHGNGIKNIKMRAATIRAEIKFINDKGLKIFLTKKNF
jgi:signal transduction histidine kinase